MKSSGKIVRFGFWLVLIGVFIIGFFKLTGKTGVEHSAFVPKKATRVLIIDQRKIGKSIFQLVKENPSLLKDFLSSSQGEEVSKEFDTYGIDPYGKIIIFRYHTSTADGTGVILKARPANLFNAFEDKFGENFKSVYKSDDNLIQARRVLEENMDITVTANGNCGIVFFPSQSWNFDSEVYESELLPMLTEAISDKENNLLANNKEFKAATEKDNEIIVWLNGEQWIPGVTKSVTSLIDFEQAGINLTSEFTFEKDKLFKKIKAFEGENRDAPFIVSTSLTEQGVESIMKNNIPKGFQPYFKGATGKIYFELTGHVSLNATYIDSEMDLETGELIEVEKTKKVTMPAILSALSVSSTKDYLANLKSDSLITEDSSGVHGQLSNGLDFFFKELSDTVILVSTKKESLDLIVSDKNLFSTLRYSINLDQMIEKAGKTSIGMAFGPFLRMGYGMFSFSELDARTIEWQDNKLITNGVIKLKEADEHSLIALIKMAKMGYGQKDFILNLVKDGEINKMLSTF